MARKFFNQQDKLLGTLFDDGIFRKVVKGSKHLYKNDQGWGINRAVLDVLSPNTEIRIKDEEDGVVYITTLERFKTGTVIDYGYHGPQIIFWKGFFDTMKNGILTKSPYVEQWMEDWQMFEDFVPGSLSREIAEKSKGKIVEKKQLVFGQKKRHE